MARLKSAQTRELRRQFYVRAPLCWLVYTCVFLLICVLFEQFVSADLGDFIADNTSVWITLDTDGVNTLWSNETSDPYTSPRWQVLWSESEGVFHVRDLSVYNAFRSLKIPLAISIYLIGCMVLVLVEFNRTLRYFDDLAGAIGSLMADSSTPVVLPERLAIIQNELNAIRAVSQDAERTAIAAERRKNELVAYLAHDVKTPLTSVIGYLSLLNEGVDLPDDARRKYTAIAFEKAERLEGLIDEFFEITRYNLQAIPIERTSVEVRLFCEQVAEAFFPDAQVRSVNIEVTAPAGEKFFVDPGKLARALGNVVRNAIAYAEEGSAVTIVAAKNNVPRENGWVLTVANKGREISEVHLQSIFEKFYREDGARSTNGGGAGLGLAIAKEIVVAHGGTIEAKSEGGVTEFIIKIP